MGVTIKGVDSLYEKLQARWKKSKDSGNTSYRVGFTQAYAIYVHENTQAHHPVGQAKFLEEPARLMRPQFRQMIEQEMKRGRTLDQAIMLIALQLQRAAQLLTPVDTGALKASAFTRKEE